LARKSEEGALPYCKTGAESEANNRLGPLVKRKKWGSVGCYLPRKVPQGTHSEHASGTHCLGESLGFMLARRNLIVISMS
jgi:hypothetical protein